MNEILVIDEDPLVRQMLEDVIKSKGYNIFTAEDAEKGLIIFECRSPQVIILDLKMPNMSGLEFLETIRPKVHMPYAVIVLTGHDADDDIKQCFNLGINSFLRKPVNIYELEGQINRNLELINNSRELNVYNDRLKQEISNKEQTLNLLKTTFNGMTEGVIAFDDGFIIRMISNKACAILDISEKQALRGSLASILGAETTGPGSVLMEAINTGLEASREDVKLFSPNGLVTPASVIVKPLENPSVGIKGLIFLKSLREEQNHSREKAGGVFFGEMISGDPQMKRIFKLIENVAASHATVLIQGDSGTGKELVAREIHNRSRRAQRPFHVANCAAVPMNLLESEFFGHEKGAFTGAYKMKPGRFELANTGTLFLDEIAEIPIDLQAKLLRALQEQKFERVGGSRSIHVDVRLIAATNQNLADLVAKKRFRDDLYYRLDVVSIKLPTLMERSSDLFHLAPHFINRLNQSENRNVKSFSTDAMKLLFSYDWPGNIRELFHVIEHAFAVSNGSILTSEHLPAKVVENSSHTSGMNSITFSEKESILRALQQSNYRKGKAAALLGISYPTLYRKIKKYHLEESG